jgi:plastocyanin
MSTILDAAVADTTTGTEAADRTTWRDVLRGAATGQLILAAFMLLITVAFEGRFDPMPVVIGLIVAGGVLWLAKSKGRGAVIYAGVVSLLLFLMVAAFGGLTVFTRPQSTFELILFGGLLVVTVLGLVATVGAFRGRGGPAAALAPRIAGGAITLLVVVGVVAGALTGSATRMPGDLALQTKHFEFTETELTADAGRISVFVENEDVATHDFTIKDVAVIDLPAQRASRGSFDVEPGTYRFYCSLHPDMEGTLKVSGRSASATASAPALRTLGAPVSRRWSTASKPTGSTPSG